MICPHGLHRTSTSHQHQRIACRRLAAAGLVRTSTNDDGRSLESHNIQRATYNRRGAARTSTEDRLRRIVCSRSLTRLSGTRASSSNALLHSAAPSRSQALVASEWADVLSRTYTIEAATTTNKTSHSPCRQNSVGPKRKRRGLSRGRGRKAQAGGRLHTSIAPSPAYAPSPTLLPIPPPAPAGPNSCGQSQPAID